MAGNGKVTVDMVLKVDLQCPYCYKKVKKILCNFPQVRDQVFDVKANKVGITVVRCDPEKIRDKLCCKGGKVIESIEIVEPRKPPPPPPPPEAPTKQDVGCQTTTCFRPCCQDHGGGPCCHCCGVPPPCTCTYYHGSCGYGYGRVSICNYYLGDENNPPVCSIM